MQRVAAGHRRHTTERNQPVGVLHRIVTSRASTIEVEHHRVLVIRSRGDLEGVDGRRRPGGVHLVGVSERLSHLIPPTSPCPARPRYTHGLLYLERRVARDEVRDLVPT